MMETAPVLPSAWRRLTRLLPLILVVFPLWLALNYTTPVPRADHWGVVIEPYLKIRGGAPFWDTVHTRFNDSRMDLPVLIHQTLIRFTGWSLTLESALCGLMAAFTVWLLLRELRVFFRENGGLWERLLPWIAAWWVLSPRQWMNWSWGIQICYALVVLLTMATIALLRSGLPRPWRIGLAAAVAMAACATFINGWLAWVLGAGFLFWDWQRTGWHRRGHIAAFMIWCAVAAGFAWLSFSGGGSISHQHGGDSGGLLGHALADPRPVVGYFFHVLGAPFSEVVPTWDRGEIRLRINETASVTFASVSLIAGAVLLLRGLRGDWKGHTAAVTLCWLLAVWGIANAAAIALARTGVVVSNPFESRYPAFTIWWHIALLGLWSLVRTPWLRRLRWVWLAAAMWGSISGSVMGLRDVRVDFDRNRLMSVAAAARHVAPDAPFLGALSSLPPDRTISTLDILEKDGLLAVPTLRDPSPAAAEKWEGGAKGTFESAAFVSGSLKLNGWALRKSDRDAVDGVLISIEPAGEPERWLGVTQRRGSREKVARKERSTALQFRVGWDYTHGYNGGVALPPGTVPKPLPPGTATFRAYAMDLETGAVSRLDGEWKLEIPIPAK